ncbi:MAG: helix-turn-helix transcriptional regulator [Candidatus Eremiobacteraeota bacterium]|nr:helix-turn-helix transcriptional regulator [Candidatus Eremiobacteraeota bacterium]MBC5828345.1 helix-turn-helix transcriptional regulator [Candidatus Eremiobacteraeota bacterium]
MSIPRSCPPTDVVAADFTEQAGLFKALGDPHRLTILATLARSESDVCVCDFTAGLPLNQPTVSHHLKILRDANLVAARRRGTWVYYTLAADVRRRMGAALGSVLPKKVLV